LIDIDEMKLILEYYDCTVPGNPGFGFPSNAYPAPDQAPLVLENNFGGGPVMTLASLLKNSLVLTFGATSLALLCSAAQAQSADGGEAAVEVVTVTGSRIANAG